MSHVTQRTAMRSGPRGSICRPVGHECPVDGAVEVRIGPLGAVVSERIAPFPVCGGLLSRVAFQMTLGGLE